MVLSSDLKRIGIFVGCAALLIAAFALTGCGNSSSTSTTAAPTPTATPVVHTAASGTAITDKLSFSQLTLESRPVSATDKNGLVFLRFKYADNDGKVYECVLPKAQSEGQYTLAEWSSTFAAYRLPKVLAIKKGPKQVDLGDYPFISPRPPKEQPSTDQQNQQLQPVQSVQPSLPPPSAGNAPDLSPVPPGQAPGQSRNGPP